MNNGQPSPDNLSAHAQTNNLLTTVTPPGGQTKPLYNGLIQTRDLSQTTLPQTVLVLFVVVLLGTTVYLVFQFWKKKNRHRRIPTVYKLEGYRYSRLNQAELDVDNSLVYCRSEEEPSELEDEAQCKPATLHVETNSLINISNCTMSTNGHGSGVMDLLGPEAGQPSSNSKLLTLEEASDEDLLQ